MAAASSDPRTPAGKRTQRRRVGIAAAAAVVALVVAGAVLWRSLRPSEGPLHWPHAGQDTVGFSDVSAGDVLTFGAVNVRNSGSSDVVLRSAELAGGDPSVAKVTKGLTVGPGRTLGGVATDRDGFPPQADFGVPLVDLDGAVVAPDASPGTDAGTELLLRVDVARTQDGTFTGVKIVYEYPGEDVQIRRSDRSPACPQTCD